MKGMRIALRPRKSSESPVIPLRRLLLGLYMYPPKGSSEPICGVKTPMFSPVNEAAFS